MRFKIDDGFRTPDHEKSMKTALGLLKKNPSWLNGGNVWRVSVGGFKTIRQEMGLTQTELGCLLDMSQKHISNIENPNNETAPSVVTCLAMLALSHLEKKDIDFETWTNYMN